MRVALLLGLLAGCDGGRPLIGVVQPDRPPIEDTAAIEDTDVDVDVGGIEVVIAWENELMPVSTCAEAGITTLSVTVDGDNAVAFPCNDSPIRRYDVPVGDRSIEVRGETGSGVVWASDAIEVDVASGDLTPAAATLRCYEEGIDDGCGGA